MTPEELQQRQAKLAALRQLRASNFYEPKTDNPEGLNLDTPDGEDHPEQTMLQPDSANLKNALQGKSREEMLAELLRQSK